MIRALSTIADADEVFVAAHDPRVPIEAGALVIQRVGVRRVSVDGDGLAAILLHVSIDNDDLSRVAERRSTAIVTAVETFAIGSL